MRQAISLFPSLFYYCICILVSGFETERTYEKTQAAFLYCLLFVSQSFVSQFLVFLSSCLPVFLSFCLPVIGFCHFASILSHNAWAHIMARSCGFSYCLISLGAWAAYYTQFLLGHGSIVFGAILTPFLTSTTNTPTCTSQDANKHHSNRYPRLFFFVFSFSFLFLLLQLS